MRGRVLVFYAAFGRAVAGAAMVITSLALSVAAYGQCNTPSNVVGPHQAICGPAGSVYDTVLFDFDGAGPEPSSLVAVGYFLSAGAEPASYVAAFDGARWRQLGNGLNASPFSVAVYDGQLYVGGDLTARGPGGAAGSLSGIARWDGAEWQPVGGGVQRASVPGRIKAMEVFNGLLYVAGSFDAAGGTTANNVASWDGTTWRSLGTGGTSGGGGVEGAISGFPIPEVNDLAVVDGRLIVGGAFSTINGVFSLGNSLARYDGTAWTGYVVSRNGSHAYVTSLAAHANPSGSWLYVGGNFTHIGGAAASKIARYARTVSGEGPWTQVGASAFPFGVVDIALQTNVTSITNVYTGAAAEIGQSVSDEGVYRLVSGAWTQESSLRPSFIGMWSGTPLASMGGLSRRVGGEWLGIGPGLNEPITTMVEHQGDLVAFGYFTASSTATLNRVARLTAGGWVPVGSGLPTDYYSPFYAASFNGQLFVVAPRLNTSDTYVLRFDGTSWAPVHSWNLPTRLRVVGSELYLLSSGVHRWNGTSFVPLGEGLTVFPVTDLLEYNGTLHAVMSNSVYRLDGNTWTLAFSPRAGRSLHAATVWNGQLMATALSPTGVHAIDRLSGSTFVESLANSRADHFADWNGRLAALGDGAPRTFDGASWTSLTTPVGYSTGLLSHGGDLISVGGTVISDQRISPLFTRVSCCKADFSGNGTVSIDDIFIFLNAWFAGCTGQANAACQGRTTDVDASGTVTIDDIFIYLNRWFAGC